MTVKRAQFRYYREGRLHKIELFNTLPPQLSLSWLPVTADPTAVKDAVKRAKQEDTSPKVGVGVHMYWRMSWTIMNYDIDRITVKN